jgi:hypothetical protein
VFPLDIVEALHEGLRASSRPPDGLLHPSGDLIGSLRHAQLTAAGAPKLDSELVSDIRLMTGTLWHRWVEDLLTAKGIRFQSELSVNPGLPEGWSGTADWLFWSDHYEGWVLGDLKTTKGEALRWIRRDGAKEQHIWQASAYWHALVEMGYPMVDGFGILYWPMNDTPDKDEVIEPSLEECAPLPRDLVWGVMEERWALTSAYLRTVDSGCGFAGYLTDALADEQERVQKWYWNGTQSVFDVKLVPHWSTAYCPFPNELCSCSEQSSNKIGHYTLDGEYVPRRGYEEFVPVVSPSTSDIRRKREEVAA